MFPLHPARLLFLVEVVSRPPVGGGLWHFGCGWAKHRIFHRWVIICVLSLRRHMGTLLSFFPARVGFFELADMAQAAMTTGAGTGSAGSSRPKSKAKAKGKLSSTRLLSASPRTTDNAKIQCRMRMEWSHGLAATGAVALWALDLFSHVELGDMRVVWRLGPLFLPWL